MAHMAKVVAPGYPHHVMQRGNRRQQTFFSDDDYQAYLGLVSYSCDMHDLHIWAYCLSMVSGSWRRFLSTDAEDHEIDLLKMHERTGRPLGEDDFVDSLEVLLDRNLKRQKPGPKKKDK